LIVVTKVFVFGLFGEKRVFLFIEYFIFQNKKKIYTLPRLLLLLKKFVAFLFSFIFENKSFDSCTALVGGNF
jgi:hypothetical protein